VGRDFGRGASGSRPATSIGKEDANSNWNAAGGFFGSNWSSQLCFEITIRSPLPGSGDDRLLLRFWGAPPGPVDTILGTELLDPVLSPFLSSNDQPVTIDGGWR